MLEFTLVLLQLIKLLVLIRSLSKSLDMVEKLDFLVCWIVKLNPTNSSFNIRMHQGARNPMEFKDYLGGFGENMPSK